MAKRRKHRRYGSIVSLPLGRLSGLFPSTKSDVAPLDVVAGGAVSFVGANVLDAFLGTQDWWMQVKNGLGKFFPLVVGGLTGFAALQLGEKTGFGKKRGAGFFWGAVAYGVARTAQNLLSGMAIPGTTATFSDVVALPLGGYNYSGLLVDNPKPMQGYNGLLVDNPVPQQSNLSALGQLSMSDDYDGMDALAAMG